MNQRSVIWEGGAGANAIASGEALTLKIQAWDLLDTDLTLEFFESDAGEGRRNTDDPLGTIGGQIKRGEQAGKALYYFAPDSQGFQRPEHKRTFARFLLRIPSDAFGGHLDVPDVAIGGEFESEKASDPKGATCEYEIGVRVTQGETQLEPEDSEQRIVARLERHLNDEALITRYFPWTPQFVTTGFKRVPKTPLGYTPAAKDFAFLGCGHVCATILLRYWGELNDPHTFAERSGLRAERCWKLTPLTREQKRAGDSAPPVLGSGVASKDNPLYSSLPYKPLGKRSTKGRRWTWEDMHDFPQFQPTADGEDSLLDPLMERRDRDPLLWAWWWRQNYIFSHLGAFNINMKAELLVEWLKTFPQPPWKAGAPETYRTAGYRAGGSGWEETLGWLSQDPPVPVVFTVAREGGGHYMIAVGVEPDRRGNPCLLVHDSGGWVRAGRHIKPVQVLRKEWRARGPHHVVKISKASWKERARRCFAVQRLGGYCRDTPVDGPLRDLLDRPS